MKSESAQIVRCKVDISTWFFKEWEKSEMKITSPSGKTITIKKTVLEMNLTQLEKVLLTIIGECKDGTALLTVGQMNILLDIFHKQLQVSQVKANQ